MCICYLCCSLIAIPFLILGSTIYDPKVSSSHSPQPHIGTVQRPQTITQGKTYPISEQYLVKGSKFDLNIEFPPKHSYTTSEECLAVIYIFEKFASYVSFLDYGVCSGFTDKQCLQNEAMYRYSLTTDQTRYYLIGLYLPDTSVFESVEFEINGHELYLDVSQHEPDCITVPDIQPECVFKFERKQYRDSRNNICILGNTPNNASQVKFTPQMQGAVFGLKVFFLFGGSVGGYVLCIFVLIVCCGCCYCMVTECPCTCKKQNE